MAAFIGLDLAWTAHRETGICRFEGNDPRRLECTRLEATVCDVESLATEISAIQGPLTVAVDAPLIVTRERWVEREVGRRFWRYKAQAHSANLDLLRCTGRTAGIDLARELERRGVTLDRADLLNGSRDGRYAVEVYPHTIHVRLFDLDERLPYKQKKGRRVHDRRATFVQYQGYLRSRLESDAPGVLGNPDIDRALSHEAAETAKGKSLKRLEDKLDAITCALAAYLLRRRPSRWEMLGDLNGYIVVPRCRAASE